MSVFRSPSGVERWRCHACSAGGTAADLVMTTQGVGFAEAMRLLAARAGMAEVDRPAPLRARAIEHQPSPVTAVLPGGIEDHVAACEAVLWSPAGASMRRWLLRRGLGEDVLRANRVGADPGPPALPRAPGLPRAGPAVILPVLDGDSRAVYLQARYLHPPAGRKYDNPTTAVAGPSPRLADVRLPGQPADPATVLVCEGLPDALIAAQAGHRATALLGAGVPDDRVAATLVARFPAERLVVAFDADERGRAGAARLVELLQAAGAAERTAVLDVPAAWGDLNGWHLAAEVGFEHELASALENAGPPPFSERAEIREDLSQRMEAIHYRHVLVDDPVLASRNLARVRRVVAQWERFGVIAESPSPSGARSALDQDLDALAYRHLLDDDPIQLRSNLAAVKTAVAGWTTGSGVDGPRRDLVRAPVAAGVGVPSPAPAAEHTLGIDL